jgi:hypothetical protein
MAAWFSIGTLSLQVGQYQPCERVSLKPRRPRLSLIAHSADPDQPFRSIAITDSGDPDHAVHYA